MSGLQWNLLDTQMPAKVATAFNPLGSFNEGQATAQRLQMNQLQMQKAQQDMEYNPMKLAAKMAGQQANIEKTTAQTEKIGIETQIKAHELRRNSADLVASASDDMILETAIQQARLNAATMGADPEMLANAEAHLTQIFNNGGPQALRTEATFQSQDAKTKLASMLGQGKLAQGAERVQQGWANVATGQMNAQTGQGNLEVNRQRLQQPNIGIMNTGQELIPYDKKGDVLQPIPLQMRPGQERMIEVAEQNAETNKNRSMSITEMGASRPHVANLMANGWMPVGRITKPMLDAVEAAAAEAEKQGLPFDPDAVRAYEFQGQKNTALGRTAGSRLVTARGQNIDTAKMLLTRMQDTAKELDFSDIKIAAIAEKWIKGQTQDPVLTRYMTQRADALFALGNALKQNGLTDKAIQIEEEAAHPTVSPRAFDAWFKVQMEALADAGSEMEKAYNPPMPNAAAVQAPAPAPAPQSSTLMAIKSDDDYNALPSGTVFTAPDGSIRRKP